MIRSKESNLLGVLEARDGCKGKIAVRTLIAAYVFYNYGTFLQHYCLRLALQRMGYKIYRVSKRDEHIETWWLLLGNVRRMCRVVFSLIFKRDTLRNTINLYYDRPSLIARHKFIVDFKRFICNQIQEPFEDKEIDAVIVGGDQVFYPEVIKEVTNRFPGKKKIIYAASADWGGELRSSAFDECFFRNLKQFQKIGLRESFGIKMLKENGWNGHVSQVADPVFLVDKNDLLALAEGGSKFKRPTLFVYLLNIRDKKDFPLSVFVELAESLSCQLKIQGTQGASAYIPSKFQVQFGPADFISAYRDAEYIVTNSYHATVVALMLHKRFVTLRQKEYCGQRQNIRLDELTREFNIEERWLLCDSTADQMLGILSKETTWPVLDEKMAIQRKRSMIWLRESLEN